MKNSTLIHALVVFSAFSMPLHADVPPIINYQGRVAVDGTNFTGTGQFRFAIINGNGSITFWTNGGGEVPVPVSKGNYSVLLGDTTLPNMASLDTASDPSANGNTDVRLRVWFNDGINGSQLLTPDQRFASVPFALNAGEAKNAINADTADTASQLRVGTASVHLEPNNIHLSADDISGVDIQPAGVLSATRVNAADIHSGTIVAENQSAGITITSYGGIHMLDSCDINIRGGQGGLHFNGSLNATGFNTSSDQNLKEKITPADSQAILKGVLGLPITCWNFKDSPGTPHIGPMAQDFHAAFNVGSDDTHIGLADEGGVALAAIQGLNAVVAAKDARIQDLERRVSEMEAKLNGLTNPTGGAK